MARGEVSRAKEGCLRLHFERFGENDILSNFITSKVIFFGKETNCFIYDITNKDNVDVTIENYKLERKFCISIIH